ncbi:MAG TPA: CheR family methyltransferase, partial [Negativicutes bacterium]|nr:CheR family methyltransferase [Negativicutes bacterium]
DRIAHEGELATGFETLFHSDPDDDPADTAELIDIDSMNKIIERVRQKTGFDFSLYKKSTICRRIHRRITIKKVDSINEYIGLLYGSEVEAELLLREFLIGVTSFFRDSAVWDKLGQSIIPEMLADMKNGQVIRAWVPACSTGEEAYSLAIVFREALSKLSPFKNITIQIFATDIDAAAIEKARRGIYKGNIGEDVSKERLSRFFSKAGDDYRVNNEIREMVVFAQQNVVMDPPFIRQDILLCRNLMIYMENELQNRLISLFHYSIKPGGYLILGNAEAITDKKGKFSQVESKLKIYKRLKSEKIDLFLDFPSAYSGYKYGADVKAKPAEMHEDIKALADQLVLQQFSPACVLVDDIGNIIYISGSTGDYLEPPAGTANWNIFAMLRMELRNEFHGAFSMAKKQKGPVDINGIEISGNGWRKTVNIRVKHIERPEALKDMVVVAFTEAPVSECRFPTDGSGNMRSDGEYMAEQEEELRRLRGELRSMFEEMQISKEELKSSNEELTTSKEELQSLNEELQAANAELQNRVDDYSRMNSDMKKLLDSLDIAALFLDRELNICRCTKQINRLFRILESDIGRPITDLATSLIYPELTEDALEVLRTLEISEKRVPARDKSWFNIRIMPYYGTNESIDGLAITFVDITQFIQAEEDRKSHLPKLEPDTLQIAAAGEMEPEEV